jgi:anti-repressor protein
MKLVFIENDRPLTDSLNVAEAFGKEHKNVMRDIANQIEKMFEADRAEFVRLNFERISYRDGLNREQHKYLLSEDAFAMVTMAYTTIEAMKFKIDFIQQFNEMKIQILNSHFKLPRTFSEALEGYAAELRRSEALDAQNKQLSLETVEQARKLKEQEAPVAIYNLAISAKNAMSMQEVAKALGTGRNRLYEILREEGIIMKGSTMPFQRFLDSGHFKVTERPRTSGDTIVNDPATRVYAKGFDYIARLLQKRAAQEERARRLVEEAAEDAQKYNIEPIIQ